METTMRRLDRPAEAASHQRRQSLLALLPLAALVACGDKAPPAAQEVRPVRVATVAARTGGDIVSLTGTVAAETEVNLAFRIDGRMIERLVNVGDRVKAGQVVARLDRQNEENELRATRAELIAARARLTEARNN
jgi:multidrug efflux pump subunit AcrA (membrane-fusion protein)